LTAPGSSPSFLHIVASKAVYHIRGMEDPTCAAMQGYLTSDFKPVISNLGVDSAAYLLARADTESRLRRLEGCTDCLERFIDIRQKTMDDQIKAIMAHAIRGIRA
jgi:hypothetical protein